MAKADKISGSIQGSVIKECTCSNEGQDLIYGPRRRVFNVMGKAKSDWCRCTVCGSEVLIKKVSVSIAKNK